MFIIFPRCFTELTHIIVSSYNYAFSQNVKHSTDSTNYASTTEHVPTKQTVHELSHSAANENVPATLSPSAQQEDDERVFRSPREHVRKQQRQDKRRKNTIYGIAKGWNIIGGLPGVKTSHLFIYGTRKETSADAIKTLLIENDITVFSAAMVSNELTTYKSFKVTIPADQKGAACLPSRNTKEYVYEISFIPLNKFVPIMDIKMGSYNCRGFNVSKIPVIKELLNDGDVLLIQETWLLPHKLKIFLNI